MVAEVRFDLLERLLGVVHQIAETESGDTGITGDRRDCPHQERLHESLTSESFVMSDPPVTKPHGEFPRIAPVSRLNEMYPVPMSQIETVFGDRRRVGFFRRAMR